jgi:hypothetical protein
MGAFFILVIAVAARVFAALRCARVTAASSRGTASFHYPVGIS